MKYKMFPLIKPTEISKVKLIARLTGIKFNERDFFINLDTESLFVFPELKFKIGDECKIDFEFYSYLMRNSKATAYTIKNFNEDHHFLAKKLSVHLFVQLSSKNYQKTFCALSWVDDRRILCDFDDAAAAVVLFYPEGLIKVEE